MAATPLRSQLIREIQVLLGGNLVDVELSPDDYETAIGIAFSKFRQLSTNSVEESYVFMSAEANTTVYKLPDEIVSVEAIYRRSIGGGVGGGGTSFDPLEQAYLNIYFLEAGRQGGLAMYDFFAGYQETVGKLFGHYVSFNFDRVTHMLNIFSRPVGQEQLVLKTQNYRPDETLLKDHYIYPWMRDYSMAVCMLILGSAYRKIGNIPGPAGGTTLPGDAMIAEAREKMEQLEQSIKLYRSGEQQGLWMVIG